MNSPSTNHKYCKGCSHCYSVFINYPYIDSDECFTCRKSTIEGEQFCSKLCTQKFERHYHSYLLKHKYNYNWRKQY